MSDNDIDAAFFKRVDAIIHLANEQGTQAPNSTVSASLLYSAARFNAFAIAETSPSADAMRQNKEKVIQYLTGEYRKMLIENLDDYIANFTIYLPRTPQQ